MTYPLCGLYDESVVNVIIDRLSYFTEKFISSQEKTHSGRIKTKRYSCSLSIGTIKKDKEIDLEINTWVVASLKYFSVLLSDKMLYEHRSVVYDTILQTYLSEASVPYDA